MRKTAVWLLALALIFTLSGCNGSNPDPDGSGSSGTSSSPDQSHTAVTPPDASLEEPSDASDASGGGDPDSEEDPGEAEDPNAGEDPSDDVDPAEPTEPTASTGLTIYAEPGAAAYGAVGLYGKVTVLHTLPDVAGALRDGSIDGAILPVSTAARLYWETDGEVQIAALTAAGALKIAEVGSSVQSIYDLAEKTVYVADYDSGIQNIFTYIAEEYGFILGDTLNLVTVSPDKLVSDMAAGKITLAVLSSADAAKVSGARVAIDLAQELSYVTMSGSILPEGCLVVPKNAGGDATQTLLDALRESVGSTGADLASAVSQGYAGSEAEARAAISGCDYIWITGGSALREELASFFELLYQIDPALLGGSIPDDGFYR